MPKTKRPRGKRGGWRVYRKALKRSLVANGEFDPADYWRADDGTKKREETGTPAKVATPPASTDHASGARTPINKPTKVPPPPPIRSPPHVAPTRKPQLITSIKVSPRIVTNQTCKINIKIVKPYHIIIILLPLPVSSHEGNRERR